jgi:GAF domain-containing protein
VTAEPRVRFYAGFPLRLDGHAIGTLCVIDHRPRHLSEVQLQLLRDLAEVVRGELTLNPAAARRR